ncbi:hypothetical protein [Psychroflexus sp. ALD_RP9]|uniref:hypothetical protein n=1 Tax=Psychroflexus sp. ALD_RP9 TaxID=2777186 RepID=UPI001A8F1336|nr:hypothetical protein [Psychroflexus sp. ALD_RP9]QSS96310.1 hypothetical protein IMZ30_07530 [Psychroflexus sp. ALD_RP9]
MSKLHYRLTLPLIAIFVIGCNYNKTEVTKFEYYEDGSLKRKYKVNDKSLITGSDSLFDRNQSLKKVTLWDNGKLVDSIVEYFNFYDIKKVVEIGRIKDSIITYKDPNGQKTSEVFLKNGLKDGIKVFYNKNGKINGFLGFKKNKKFGPYIKLKENNIPEFLLVEDQYYKVILSTSFYDDGKMSLINITDLNEGFELMFYPSGSLKKITEVKKNGNVGRYYWFSEDGKLMNNN